MADDRDRADRGDGTPPPPPPPTRSGSLGIFDSLPPAKTKYVGPFRSPPPPPPPPIEATRDAPVTPDAGPMAADDQLARIESLLRENVDALAETNARLHAVESRVMPSVDEIVDAVRSSLGTISVDLTPLLDDLRAALAEDVPSRESEVRTPEIDVDGLADAVRARIGDLSIDVAPLLDALDANTTVTVDVDTIRDAVTAAVAATIPPPPDTDRVADAVQRTLDAHCERVETAVQRVADSADARPALNADEIAAMVRDVLPPAPDASAAIGDLGQALLAGIAGIDARLDTIVGAPSAVDSDPIVDAIRDEMSRSTAVGVEAATTALRAVLDASDPRIDPALMTATIRDMLHENRPPSIEVDAVARAVVDMLPPAVDPNMLASRVADAVGRVDLTEIESRLSPPALDVDAVAAAIAARLAPPQLDAAAIARHVAAAVTDEVAAVAPRSDDVAAAVREAILPLPIDDVAIAVAVAEQVRDTVVAATVEAFDQRRHADRSDDRAELRAMVEALIADQSGLLSGLTSEIRAVGTRIDGGGPRSTEVQAALASIRTTLNELRVMLATRPATSAPPSTGTASSTTDAPDIDVIRRTVAASHRALSTQLSTVTDELASVLSRDREQLLESFRSDGRTTSSELIALDQLARDVAALRREVAAFQGRDSAAP